MIRELAPGRQRSVADPKHPNVLLVVDQLAKTMGGGERILLKLAAKLPEYGFQPSILTFLAHPESAALPQLPCPTYVLPLARTYDLNAMRAALKFSRFLKERRIRLVHTFFESSDLWAGFVTKTGSSAKLIWSRRDMGILRDRKHEIAYRLMARMPDAVFAVSEEVRQHCIQVDKVPAARVRTIYNGLDLSRWEQIAKPDKLADELVIKTVGNIRRVKGHDVLVQAAAIVVRQFPNARFSIGGEILEKDYFQELQQLVSDLGLSGHFHFTGGITDLPEFLRFADIFVLPSRSEGFSNAIVEAMAASLPVVATQVGGNGEAVQENVTGFLVPSEDASALADRILRLLSDPQRANEMGKAGKQLVAEKFTTAAMMQQTTDVYRSLLNAGK